MFNFKKVMSEFDAITGYRYMYLSTASANTKYILRTFKIKSGSYWRRVLNCVVLLHFNSSCYTSTSVLKLWPKKLFLDLRCQKNKILGFIQLWTASKLIRCWPTCNSGKRTPVQRTTPLTGTWITNSFLLLVFEVNHSIADKWFGGNS